MINDRIKQINIDDLNRTNAKIPFSDKENEFLLSIKSVNNL